jgi:hypothetical protein
MARKFGDAVVLVKKSLDGKIDRVNGIVLASSTYAPRGNDRKVLKDAKGADLPPSEHLTLAVVQAHEGIVKNFDMNTFFAVAHDQVAFDEKIVSGWGWELPAGVKADDNSAGGRKAVAMDKAKADYDAQMAVINQDAEKDAAKAKFDATCAQIEKVYQTDLAAEKAAADKGAVDAKPAAPKPAVVVKAVAILAMFCLSLFGRSASAQNLPPTWVYARDYNYGSIAGQQANTYTFNGPGACTYTPTSGSLNGLASSFFVFSGTQGATTVYFPVVITDATAANSEVVTPTATTQGATTCGFAATTANSHTSFTLGSGTAGLQEAVASQLQSGPTFDVVLDKAWYQLVAPFSGYTGGSTAASIIAAVTGNINVAIVDTTTSPWTFYSWNGTKYVPNASGGSAASAFTSVTQVSAPAALTTVAATCASNGGGCITVSTTGGTIPASAVYTFAATYVTADGGETLMSIDTAAGATSGSTTTATSSITVTSPAPATGAVGWRLYVTAASGATVTEILYANSCSALSTGQSVLSGVCAIGASATVTKIITGTALGPSLTGATTSVSSAFIVPGGSPGPLQVVPVAYPPFASVGASLSAAATATIGEVNLPAGYLNVLGRTVRICGTGIAASTTTGGTLTVATNLASLFGTTAVTPFTVISGTDTASQTINFNFCTIWTTTATGASGTVEAHGWLGANLAGTTAVSTMAQDLIHVASSTVDLTKQDLLYITLTPGTQALAAGGTQLRQLTLETLQ